MQDLAYSECWLFAALISVIIKPPRLAWNVLTLRNQATDPVSTLVLFAELRVEPHLFYLVFGESVMNDAVGIVLFDTTREFVVQKGKDTEEVGKAVGFFCLNLLGSLVVGLLLSVFMGAVIRRSQLKHNLVLLLLGV